MAKFEKLEASLLKFAKNEAKKKTTDALEWLRSNQGTCIEYMLKENERTSPRTIVLNYAIAAKLGIDGANEVLKAYDHEALYIRNMSDMVCMWVLKYNGTATDACRLYQELSAMEIGQPSTYKIPNITLSEIERYLESAHEILPAEVKSMTADLQDKFNAAIVNNQSVEDMVRDNLAYFTNMRDRTRHEFLLIFRDYLHTVIKGGDKEEQKGVFMSSAKDFLEEGKVKLGNFVTRIDDLFDGALLSAFEFYDDSSTSQKEHISGDQFEKMTKEEKREFFNSLEPEDKAYEEACVKCEKIYREFIQGKVDITRTLFIASVMFMNTRLKESDWLDIDALNEVLQSCGWRTVQTINPKGLDELIVAMYSKEPNRAGYTKRLIFDDSFQDLLFENIDTLANYAGFNHTKSRDATFISALEGNK